MKLKQDSIFILSIIISNYQEIYDLECCLAILKVHRNPSTG